MRRLILGLWLAAAGLAQDEFVQEPVPVWEPQISYRAAARFLDQATFGADPPSVGQLQQMGFESWLNEQFALAPTPIPDAPADVTNLVPVQRNFFYNAVAGRDQLRQRVAFVLSQIWVVSGAKIGRPEAFLPYLRLLQKNAFGNYYDLMYDITLSPAMGNYLDMVNNGKANPATGRAPNENYARELLQLFTIGMEQLNDDGTPQLDEAGRRKPAYDQETIEELARVFTGWTYPPAPGQASRPRNPAYWEGAMAAFASIHDTGPKTLLDGLVVPAGQSPEKDLADALRIVFNHHNIGPFIGKQLIQHLVTSNPSPAYVSRVAAAFNDNGAGVRGDLRAVIRAILLDPEARQYDEQPPPEAHSYGHLREPVLLITGLARALGATVPDANNLAGFARTMGQNPYYSPSVFNYFAPSYEVPGTDLLGPEFQLLSPSNAMARVNFLNRLFFGNLGDGTTLNLSVFTEAAPDPQRLLDLVNATLFHGSMPGSLRESIFRAVTATSDAQTRAKSALYLAASSGQYQVEQ